MRQSLRYASWLLLLFILLSCSHRVTGEATALPPILQAEAQSQKYNLQLDFMKHHFSGMLIVRQMPDNEIRQAEFLPAFSARTPGLFYLCISSVSSEAQAA